MHYVYKRFPEKTRNRGTFPRFGKVLTTPVWGMSWIFPCGPILMSFSSICGPLRSVSAVFQLSTHKSDKTLTYGLIPYMECDQLSSCWIRKLLIWYLSIFPLQRQTAMRSLDRCNDILGVALDEITVEHALLAVCQVESLVNEHVGMPLEQINNSHLDLLCDQSNF
jgi:hypothetical protein